MSLSDFVQESNRIEGIHRQPLPHEIAAHEAFLACERISVESLSGFVSAVQPDAKLRTAAGMNVQVGSFLPPRGGPEIRERLDKLLLLAKRPATPKEVFMVHHGYENLHPFTDGNGRSGRILWLWMMGGRSPLGFLHQWYYQSLAIEVPPLLCRS
jgi:hypothetical protein